MKMIPVSLRPSVNIGPLPRMKKQPLSPETRRRLDMLFAPENRAAAEQLLVDECGNNLPFLHELNQFQLERFRFAALKLSEGRLPDLEQAIGLAKRDWRDLLMAAGFGDDVTEHERWWRSKDAG
jgi:hypothetical protein